jgi:hypothetical protein
MSDAYITPTSPLAGAADQSPLGQVSFVFVDNGEVDRTSIVVTIAGEVAYQDSAVQDGWRGSVTAAGENVTFVLSRLRSFAFGTHVEIDVAWNETHLVGGG